MAKNNKTSSYIKMRMDRRTRFNFCHIEKGKSVKQCILLAREAIEYECFTDSGTGCHSEEVTEVVNLYISAQGKQSSPVEMLSSRL